jgi:LAO/AO transport system kinase
MVQAMKAGIMEVADLYVINKADLPGAQRIANEITRVLHIAGGARDGWTPLVLLTSIRDEASIARLSDEIDRHQAWLAASGLAPQRHAARVRYRLRNLLDRCVAERITALPPAFFEQPFEQQFRAVVQALAPPR